MTAGDPLFDNFLADTRKLLGAHQSAAMVAVDIAVMGWVCKRLNTLYAYLGSYYTLRRIWCNTEVAAGTTGMDAVGEIVKLAYGSRLYAST